MMHTIHRPMALLAAATLCICVVPVAAADPPQWSGLGQYRLLVRVEPRDIGARQADESPADVAIDFPAVLKQLGIAGRGNAASLQVVEYDPQTGMPAKYQKYRYARSKTEPSTGGASEPHYDRPFRWYDAAIPHDFPQVGSYVNSMPEKLAYKPVKGGGYWLDAEGSWERGHLAWIHDQRGDRPTSYAIYFDALPADQMPSQRAPRGWLGDGQPRFDKTSGQSINGDHARVDAADFNGDGLVDLLVGDASGHLQWWANQGTRSKPRFPIAQLVVSADAVPIDVGLGCAPKLTDFDADGDLDLLLGANRNRLVWFADEGTPGQRRLVYRGPVLAGGQPLELPARPLARGSEAVFKNDYYPVCEACDWDGDGDLDLLAGGYVTGRIYWYENKSQQKGMPPELDLRGPLEADGQPLNVQHWCAAPCAADFDGDGDLDLLSGQMPMYERAGERATLKFYENIGRLGEPRLIERPLPLDGKLPGLALGTPRAADWDGDGDLDLIVSARSDLYLFANAGTAKEPRFSPQPGRIETEWTQSPLAVDRLLDWDGDGRLDLVSNYTVRLCTDSANPGLWDKQEQVLPRGQWIAHPSGIGDDWFWPFLDDFDSDGRRDILFGAWHGNIWLHRNEGQPGMPRFDLTGVKLLLASGKELQVGPIGKDPAKDFDALQGARTVFTAADFDEDGLKDLVVGDTYGKVRYFRSRGPRDNPRLEEPVEIGDLGIRLLVSEVDWDQDGHRDVMAGAANGKVRMFRNTGNKEGPRFEPGVDPKLPPIPQPGVLVADMNGDGDEDLLVKSTQGTHLVERSFLSGGYAKATVIAVEKR